jgi:hypothetical protein
LTATFKNVSHNSATANSISILDLPTSSMLLLPDRQLGSRVTITNINLEFERAKVPIGGGSVNLNRQNLTSVTPNRRCGAIYWLTESDFVVTKGHEVR